MSKKLSNVCLKLKSADSRLGVIHEQEVNKYSLVSQHVWQACGQVLPKEKDIPVPYTF